MDLVLVELNGKGEGEPRRNQAKEVMDSASGGTHAMEMERDASLWNSVEEAEVGLS